VADIVLRAPRAGDAEELAANLRAQDRAELVACGESDAVAAIKDGIEASVLCWTIDVGGRVAAVLGLTPLEGLLGDIGVPWMLGTDLVRRHRGALVRLAPAYIARMLAAYPHLLNFVHAENSVAIRWLRSMGFELQPAIPYGPLGAPFHRFDLKA
jgi:ribosomal protein S18 acetylase RimI-like enzyme